MKKICSCKDITEDEIVEAIKNGATSVEDIMKITGAGSGGCYGAKCTRMIELLIEKNM